MLRKDLRNIKMNIGDVTEYTAKRAAKNASTDGAVSSAKQPRATGKRSKSTSPRQEKKEALNKTLLEHQIRSLYNRMLALNERTMVELAKAESCGILDVIQPTSASSLVDGV